MSLLSASTNKPITLQLNRDLTRSLKRGHPWVFADALRSRPKARPGSLALLLDKQGRQKLAWGFYDPDSPLAFRVCSLDYDHKPDEAWVEQRLTQALTLRQALFDERTTGFRLCNGEGDGLPGLVCDIYGDTAVLRLDGEGPGHFWNVEGIAGWMAGNLSLKRVYQRWRRRGDAAGRTLLGDTPTEAIPFFENDHHFTADVVNGQKTGFFLDQRDNRQRLGRLAAGKRVLNLFGYTGGFSVYAGLGGAAHVTTVDLAQPALDAAGHHWQLNGLSPDKHHLVAADAFTFLDEAAKQGRAWEMVILDPPSFAPAKKAVPQAIAAYRNLIAAGAAVTTPDGLLAAASCSSHVSQEMFLDACEAAVSRARRRATILSISGQPPDHPAPLVAPELRYLKFVLMLIA